LAISGVTAIRFSLSLFSEIEAKFIKNLFLIIIKK
jgi:hypothetical protein